MFFPHFLSLMNPLYVDPTAGLIQAMHFPKSGETTKFDYPATVDPSVFAFEKRMSEQSAKIRQGILAEHGVLNVAVDLIREGRDEE